MADTIYLLGDFDPNGKLLRANGTQYIDIHTRLKYKQAQMPKGANWVVIEKDVDVPLNTSASSSVTFANITGLVSDNAALVAAFNTKQDVGNYITGLTGDIVASGPGNVSATLADTTVVAGNYVYASLSINSQGRITAASNGTVTSGTVTSIIAGAGLSGGTITTTGTISMPNIGTVGTYNLITTDAQGRVSSGSLVAYLTGNQTITLTGDITGSGTTAIATTLATVNSTPGPYGSASSVATFTVNGKGLVISSGSAAIQITESQVTNLTTDLAARVSTTLTSGNILVGNVSNVATSVAMSGDITISNAGVTAIGNDKVVTLKILNSNVTYAKIQDITATNRLLGRYSTGSGVIQEITVSTGLTLATSGNFTANISTGIAGGQTIYGGTAASENLTIYSTSHATKGFIYLGTYAAYDGTNQRFGLGTLTPLAKFSVDNIVAYGGEMHRYRTGAGTETNPVQLYSSYWFNRVSSTMTEYWRIGINAASGATSAGNTQGWTQFSDNFAFYAVQANNFPLVLQGANGRVGIQIQQPARTLDVLCGNAVSRFTGNSVGSGALEARWNNGGADSANVILSTNTYSIYSTIGLNYFEQKVNIGVIPGSTTAYFQANAVNASYNSWTTTGVGFVWTGGNTYTDATGNSTIALRVVNSLASSTIAAIPGHTVVLTDAVSWYFNGAPSTGLNTTITNGWAVGMDGGMFINNGNLQLGTLGKKLKIKSGANGTVNSATLVAGTVTINNTSITATCVVFYSNTTVGVNSGVLSTGTIIPGVSFVVTSSNVADTSTFTYLIIDTL